MVVLVVLARRLGPASFGLFVFVQWVIEITSLVCSGGLPGAATRFFPQTVGNGGAAMPGFSGWFVRRGVAAVILTGLVATICLVAFADLGGTMALLAAAFWATSYAAWALLGARAQGLFEFKRYAAASALFVVIALAGLALPAGGGILTAMLCLGAANAAAAGVCALDFTSGSNRGVRITDVDAQQIRSYATNAWLTSIAASFVWSRGEISVIKGHLGESAVGFYSVGLTLSGVVNQGIGLLTGGLWPQIASGWDVGDRGTVLRLSNLITNVLMLAAALSAGFVICFAPYLVTLLFGRPFLQSSHLVVILALGPLALAAGCAHLVLQAASNGRFARNITLAGGLSLAGVALILVPRFGLAGAAIARTGTQIALAIATLAWLGRVTGHSSETRQNLRAFLAHVTLAVILVTVLTLQPDLQAPGRLALFAIYSSVVCLLCAPIRDRAALRQLRSIVSAHG